MPTTTSRLGIDVVAGTDLVSSYPTTNAQQMGILDGSILYSEGTLASRPSAAVKGRIYKGTDTGLYYFDTGSAWLTMTFAENVVAATTSRTATYNTLYICNGGITLTLPAPVLGQTVDVIATAGITSASPATVAYGTGAGVIVGPGLTGGVSSYVLGTGAVTTRLISDGTNWLIIDGQRDTGWLPITLGGSFSALSGYYTPAARVIGGTCFLRGAASGSSFTNVGTVPTVAKPASSVGFVIVDPTGSSTVPCTINTAGTITATGSVSGVALDGISYSLN